MDRVRRPNIRASSGISSAPHVTIFSRMLCPTALAERGERPPATTNVGTLLEARESQKAWGATACGAPSITAWPFAPVMPELVIAMSGRAVGDRALRGSGSKGTRKRYFFQFIAGFGMLRLTLGGMMPRSSAPQTLHREARNEVISKCLERDSDQHMYAR